MFKMKLKISYMSVFRIVLPSVKILIIDRVSMF